MKTPLNGDDELIRTVLLEQWHLEMKHLSFIPIGDSAYSYRVMTHSDSSYYLKLVDQRTARGCRIGAHMDFSLPLQRLVVEQHLAEVTASLPQPTINGALYAIHELFLFALYTFINGDTFADAYPMSPTLVQKISQALAALHTIQLPKDLQERSPQDSLTAPFDASLLADLASLQAITSQDALYLQRLREVVWPRREQIRAFLAHSQEYARKAHQTPVSSVACHGDAWGGNMIMSPSGQLTLLDWESAVMAPPERDAFKYIGYTDGPDFTAFDIGYRMIRKEPMRWHADWLAYYAYRLQLKNLEQWMHNLLHESLNEVQRDNDVTMIEHHCLDRWESVERTAAGLVAMLS
ncbi:MAG TPA: aminoglycoside phosphotransferase family protein [Ktedonobacteraceae bacterium]|jgi:spectinomycin phosphotransferase